MITRLISLLNQEPEVAESTGWEEMRTTTNAVEIMPMRMLYANAQPSTEIADYDGLFSCHRILVAQYVLVCPH